MTADPGVADFDALQEDPERWIGVIAALGARYASATAVPAGEATVLVALLGRELVLKLYPPFLRDHFAFERGMLGHLQGQLSLPTPRLVDSAEHAGWPYLVMTRLPGTPLDRVWPALRQRERCAVLHTIGRLAAGDAERIDALFDGYHGRPFDRGQREALMRLLLLHRYSNLTAQIAVPGWQAAPDFATLAAVIWP